MTTIIVTVDQHFMSCFYYQFKQNFKHKINRAIAKFNTMNLICGRIDTTNRLQYINSQLDTNTKIFKILINYNYPLYTTHYKLEPCIIIDEYLFSIYNNYKLFKGEIVLLLNYTYLLFIIDTKNITKIIIVKISGHQCSIDFQKTKGAYGF